MAAPGGDEAAKARIMGHMNKDHATELAHYLRAFNGLSSWAARNAQMTAMSLDAMTIKSASGVHTVSISPPMGSMADARVRLVDMAKKAQEKLGVSDIKINTYTIPEGLGLATFVGVSVYIVAAISLPWLQPGTLGWEIIDAYFPYGAPGFRWLVKAIMLPVILIHVTEMWWMSRTRIDKYSVPLGSLTWFLWMANTAIEGYPGMVRFDGLVAAERKKKEAVKH